MTVDSIKKAQTPPPPPARVPSLFNEREAGCVGTITIDGKVYDVHRVDFQDGQQVRLPDDFHIETNKARDLALVELYIKDMKRHSPGLEMKQITYIGADGLHTKDKNKIYQHNQEIDTLTADELQQHGEIPHDLKNMITKTGHFYQALVGKLHSQPHQRGYDHLGQEPVSFDVEMGSNIPYGQMQSPEQPHHEPLGYAKNPRMTEPYHMPYRGAQTQFDVPSYPNERMKMLLSDGTQFHLVERSSENLEPDFANEERAPFSFDVELAKVPAERLDQVKPLQKQQKPSLKRILEIDETKKIETFCRKHEYLREYFKFWEYITAENKERFNFNQEQIDIARHIDRVFSQGIEPRDLPSVKSVYKECLPLRNRNF